MGYRKGFSETATQKITSRVERIMEGAYRDLQDPTAPNPGVWAIPLARMGQKIAPEYFPRVKNSWQKDSPCPIKNAIFKDTRASTFPRFFWD
jgi:hypothetical protein